MNIKYNTTVVLKSFLGLVNRPEDVSTKEDYWKLMGKSGIVIDLSEDYKKALLLFDQNLDDLSLENHNAIKNTLWIRISDLEISE
jgi:hypothetical protein